MLEGRGGSMLGTICEDVSLCGDDDESWIVPSSSSGGIVGRRWSTIVEVGAIRRRR